MNWKKIAIPEGAKLFKVHSFTYIHKGATYQLWVDEYADGKFTGHGEHSTDKSSVLSSVSGSSIEECLSALTGSIKK